MPTSATLKTLVLAAIVCVGMELPAHARWVHVEVGSNKAIVYFGYNTKGFGVRGQTVEPLAGATSPGRPYSVINYGAGSIIVWLPFWGAVSILAALPVFGFATTFMIVSRISRRRRLDAGDRGQLTTAPLRED